MRCGKMSVAHWVVCVILCWCLLAQPVLTRHNKGKKSKEKHSHSRERSSEEESSRSGSRSESRSGSRSWASKETSLEEYYEDYDYNSEENECDIRRGQKGEPGLPGILGMPGMQPPPGQKGGKGSGGLPGIMGITGLPGTVGQPGTPGKSGESGDYGLDGLPGEKGLSGYRGETGPNGTRGSHGDPGIIGLNGKVGYQGLPGVRGEIGECDCPTIKHNQLVAFSGESLGLNMLKDDYQNVSLSNPTINEGGAYDNISAYFTAPANGIYQFSVTVTAQGSSAIPLVLFHNDKEVMTTARRSASSIGEFPHSTNLVLLILTKGDHVILKVRPARGGLVGSIAKQLVTSSDVTFAGQSIAFI